MSTPRPREQQVDMDYAPRPVHRPKRSWLRRHWLSGAFVLTLAGVSTFAMRNFYETQAKLEQVRETRAQLEQQLEAAKRENEALEAKHKQVTSDAYMEQLAKKMGFVYKNETVYQKGP